MISTIYNVRYINFSYDQIRFYITLTKVVPKSFLIKFVVFLMQKPSY